MKTLGRPVGTTLVELLIVLAIVAALLGLLVPAIMVARERARDAVCKNHVRQLSLGITQYVQTAKTLPPRPSPGRAGGWSVEVLPFVEQSGLYGQLGPSPPLAAAPMSARARPSIMRCPVAIATVSTTPPFEAAQFVMAGSGR